jgi:hypothetical protein
VTQEEDVLTEILATVKRIEASLSKSKASASASKAEGDVATDADLDGKYGDEEIRRDPSAKYWEGESQVSRRMSECPADYLDAYAKYKNARAFMNEKEGKEDKAKYVGYDRKSAARARGWAQRIRSGYKAPERAPVGDDGGDVPF